jgi:DNA polymerase III epsilon subunit-like protein
MAQLPQSLVVVDVETTGLHSNDRIVTFGAWRIETSGIHNDALQVDCVHLIADPGKKSHPKAEQVHGYSDWTLRHQQPFAENAEAVRQFIMSGDIVIAHNAGFDLAFIEREYQALGHLSPLRRHYCTMDGYRQRGAPGSASLNAICRQMGLSRMGQRHGALEDAWLALMIYFWLHDAPAKHIQPFSALAEKGAPTIPTNFRDPGPMPEGPLPRRARRSALPEAHSSINVNKALRETLMKELRPTALLLLEVAKSDGLAGEEIDVLTSLIRETADRLSLTVDPAIEHELLAELFDIEISQNILTRSARALCDNPVARQTFPKWLAMMAMADGDLSVSERAGIDRVKAAITRVLKSG